MLCRKKNMQRPTPLRLAHSRHAREFSGLCGENGIVVRAEPGPRGGKTAGSRGRNPQQMAV